MQGRLMDSDGTLDSCLKSITQKVRNILGARQTIGVMGVIRVRDVLAIVAAITVASFGGRPQGARAGIPGT